MVVVVLNSYTQSFLEASEMLKKVSCGGNMWCLPLPGESQGFKLRSDSATSSKEGTVRFAQSDWPLGSFFSVELYPP